jgi:spore germination cell wall hydrolase CwlJ-like protein
MRWLPLLALLLLAPPAQAAGPRLSYALECLALNVYFEADAGLPADQLAVAYVTLNRVRAEGFPGSVCEVVHQGGERPRYGCQFHWWCDGLPDVPANEARWQAALAAARAAMARTAPDPTGGALWFHNHTVTPDWAARKTRTAVIGGHSYYK